MLECTPPGLDQGVREADIPQRRHTTQQPGDDDFVHAGVDILDTGVSDQRRRIFGTDRSAGGGAED
ncbi:MAG: hypothetical protein QNJ87_12730, partial [Gammaproteobacteria bacterium]|nr:hypothetical protein [Gammaproteobacteria bacterium]